MRIPVALACVTAAASVFSFAAPAIADASWGAIAVDRSSGSNAGVSGYATASAARRAARSQCQSSCKILVTVQDACGAVIKTRRDTYVAGRGSSVRRATRNAAKRAHTRSYHRIASVCSF